MNEKLGSPLVYVTSENPSDPIKSVVTNAKQTLQIARRWNDLQRRSRLKAINAIPYTDENFDLDHEQTPSTQTLHHPTPVISVDVYTSRNILHQVETTFDRLTRDIQFAVNEVHSVPTEAKIR